MIIRKATLQDIPEINKLDDFGTQLGSYSVLDHLDLDYKPKGKGYYERFITGKKKWCLVAEENGTILGFILFLIKTREPYWKIKRVGYLDLIIVGKEHRGKGIAKLLINEMCRILKNKNINYVQLSVHSQNPAKHAWERMGFKIFREEMFREI